MNDFKFNLREFYNADASDRNQREKSDWKIDIRNNFLNLVKSENKSTLLELGAGTGHDSKFFMDNGLIVTAVDLSPEMIKLCRKKSVDAYELDFYNLPNLEKKFDSIWAMNSLLHVLKTDLPDVLCNIKAVMNDNGLFYMGVYGGIDSEHEYIKDDISQSPRYFASYTENTLKSVISGVFDILSFTQIKVGENTHDLHQSIILRNV